jgi:hypothetical protein
VYGILLAVTAACGGSSASLSTEREVRGDTLIVRTLAGSIWGTPRTFEDDVRIGVLDGADEYVFGQIQSLAVDAAGGLYVYDGQVPVVRYYDSIGTWVRNVGRDGAGPGEYGNTVVGLAVRSDGHLVLHDYRNARLNLYEPDGTFVTQWRVSSSLLGSNALTLDTSDHSYLRILAGPIERGKPWPFGLEHRTPAGMIVDTLVPPTLDNEPDAGGGFFTPSKVWAFSPLGYFVVGVTSTYRIEARLRNGRVMRIERAVEPIRIGADERAAYEARNDWMRENQGQFLSSPIPPVPDVKPAWQSVRVADEGRLWVRRSTPGAPVEVVAEGPPGQPPAVGWRDPQVYDVFEPDGTYLGEVRVPDRTTLYVIRGMTAWGVRLGEFDEQYVVRLLAVPSSASP